MEALLLSLHARQPLASSNELAASRRRARLLRLTTAALPLLRRYRDPVLALPRIDLRAMDKVTFKAMFRFEKDDFFDIAIPHLGLPDTIITSTRVTAVPSEALAMTFRRMGYPGRLHDMRYMFHCDAASISSIFTFTIEHIHSRFGHLLGYDESRLNQERLLQALAHGIHVKTCALSTCFGFLDGTVRPMARPSSYQRTVYNGHKRVHGLKYQSIVTADGLIVHLSESFVGKRHDSRVLRESGIMDALAQSTRFGENQYCIYGDAAYILRPYLTVGFKGTRLTRERLAFNTAMSIGRVAVGWCFGKVLQNFAFVDFKKNQKIFLQPIGKQYRVAVVLTNVHTYLYGSETSDYFGCMPPTVGEYLHSGV